MTDFFCIPNFVILWNKNSKVGREMSGSFYGRYENSVSNRRISIPVQFREKFSLDAEMTVVATHWRLPNIIIYPLDTWNKKRDNLSKLDVSEEEKLEMALLSECAAEITLEGPGRILVPQYLLDYAEIKDKVIILGSGDKMIFWNPERFEQHILRIYQLYKTYPDNRDFLL